MRRNNSNSNNNNLRNQFNHAFGLLIFMPRLKTLILFKIRLKLSYFEQKKYKVFELCPQTSKTAPSLQISGYLCKFLPACLCRNIAFYAVLCHLFYGGKQMR